MNQIRQYFEKIVSITDGDWEFFSSKLVRNSFAANHILLHAGEIENYLSFIEKGTLRYYIPKDEGEQTVDFAFANNFLSAYGSFITQSPSVYAIETLTDTVVWSIQHSDLQQVYLKTDIGNTIGRLASEQLYLNKSKREISLLNDSAEQRYLNLFKEQPHLIQQIPLKYLASYIGITPQALSRIRRRI